MIIKQLPYRCHTIVLGVLLFLLCPSLVNAASPSAELEFGRLSTPRRDITLDIVPSPGAREMRVSNVAGFFDEPPWQAVRTRIRWTLEHGAGVHNVYVQFRDGRKRKSSIVTDSIQLTKPRRFLVDVSINNGDSSTDSRYVTLVTTSSVGIEAMAIVNGGNSTFAGVEYMPLRKKQQWILSRGKGKKLVRVRFRDINGNTYTHQRGIYYDQPDFYLHEGSLLKGSGPTVYYLGFDGQIHPFPHVSVFHSYDYSFADIQHVADAKLAEYHIGASVCMRAGTWLVKFRSLPRVYAVEPGCVLRPIRSESEAYILYGSRWAQKIVEIDSVFSSMYAVHLGTPYTASKDRDRDGVDKETESRYGISDQSFDTDDDGLSDYEEIYTWFTNPAQSDSDGDGVTDGAEIQIGQSPAGSGSIEKIQTGSYTFPRGSVVEEWWNKRQMYYVDEQDNHMYVSQNFTDKSFTSNNFQRRFVVHPPIEHTLEPESSSRIETDDVRIHAPQTRASGVATLL